ncbi:hypothetical protein F5148DRAFT_973111 [Russula earlei]|uniref:Uncharacterized protein n=1 Tax=Russula earlei TaxID=71964 RepID=A0ACC0UNP9_9AGAM|nr:hypothetical protein F5148DRAFT_973111 [Russula earlei]
MDILPENDTVVEEAPVILSYDEDVVYEDQLLATPEPPRLADRINRNKVYLLSESNVTRGSKVRRKRDQDEELDAVDKVEMSIGTSLLSTPTRRPNALLLHGPPIAHLPTKLIFEYVTHFDAKPLGLEWVDDTTCVLLFSSSAAATAAFSLLRRTVSETPDEHGFLLAKSIPMAFWPPKERIDASLGKSEGLKGTLLLRWAEVTDVKERGARNRSEFYRKHGVDGQPGGEARREDAHEEKRRRREELDNELDAFLREDSQDEVSRPESPPSKMRADYIENMGRGKSLLERTSQIREHYTEGEDVDSWKSLEFRSTRPRPLTGRPRKPAGDGGWEPGRRGAWNENGEIRSRHGRPKKSQQELDDELDAFLNERE